VKAAALSAARAGIIACLTCGLLSRPAAPEQPGYCPRCGASLVWRRRHSIQYTWALLIAAAICYIPANALPVLGTTALGSTEFDTIIGGVIFLYSTGSWPLALIVFIASICVPIAKIISLVSLLVSVHRHSDWRPADRTRLYRITEAIGRWSMVDIYVVTILVALVRLGNLATIEAGWGAVFFGSVVVLTMIAAESFDPRLIWDNCGTRRA